MPNLTVAERQSPPIQENIKWVSVNDALPDPLPDDDIAVLISHVTLSEPVWIGYFQNNAWHSIDGWVLELGVVTHWSYIPKGVSLTGEINA